MPKTSTLLQFSNEIESIHARKAQIGNDQIARILFKILEQDRSIVKVINDIISFQHRAKDAPEDRMVIQHSYATPWSFGQVLIQEYLWIRCVVMCKKVRSCRPFLFLYELTALPGFS